MNVSASYKCERGGVDGKGAKHTNNNARQRLTGSFGSRCSGCASQQSCKQVVQATWPHGSLLPTVPGSSDENAE